MSLSTNRIILRSPGTFCTIFRITTTLLPVPSRLAFPTTPRVIIHSQPYPLEYTLLFCFRPRYILIALNIGRDAIIGTFNEYVFDLLSTNLRKIYCTISSSTAQGDSILNPAGFKP